MEPGASDSQRRDVPAVSGPPDEQLVNRVLKGDSKAFDELINRYQRQAVAVSFRLLGNTNDALEVSQDAFLKAYTSLNTLQKPGAFGGWLMRIVSNLSLNYRRSRKIRQQLPLDDLLGKSQADAPESGGSEWMSQSGDPLHNLASREMGERLARAMQQLPEKQRLALTMFTIDEMPQKQIAEVLKCS